MLSPNAPISLEAVSPTLLASIVDTYRQLVYANKEILNTPTTSEARRLTAEIELQHVLDELARYGGSVEP